MKHREDNEQMAIVKWAKWQKYGDGKLSDYLHHSPNGGKRHITTAVRFKAMGTLAGFPDLFLFIPKGDYHGLFIELKVKGGRTNDNQKTMIERLIKQGYMAVVCFGADDAIQAIKNYINLD